jgi:hypothetical protein
MKKVILSMLAVAALTFASCKHNETEGNVEAVVTDSTAVVVDSTSVEVKVDSTKADTTKVVAPVKEVAKQ